MSTIQHVDTVLPMQVQGQQYSLQKFGSLIDIGVTGKVTREIPSELQKKMPEAW